MISDIKSLCQQAAKLEPYRSLCRPLYTVAELQEGLEYALGRHAVDIIRGNRTGDPAEAALGAILYDLLRESFRENANTVLVLGWDGDFPGMSGAIYIEECVGIYMVCSSDEDDRGPFCSLSEALECECFSVVTANPKLSSNVIPESELEEIAKGVVDWDNEGEILINHQFYQVVGSKLVKKE